MARLIVLANHELTALRTHIGSSGSVVIVEQSVLDRADLTTADAERYAADYAFGGDPDVRLDMVASAQHYFITGCLENRTLERCSSACAT